MNHWYITNGHFRNRLIGGTYHIFLAYLLGLCLREYPHKTWPKISYSTSIVGSWNSHWYELGKPVYQPLLWWLPKMFLFHNGVCHLCFVDSSDAIAGFVPKIDHVEEAHPMHIVLNIPKKITEIYPLVNQQLDPESYSCLMETNLPTPIRQGLC